jgi:precorrin-2 dehydrogenase/sirohydrochlorin ferrochelatase
VVIGAEAVAGGKVEALLAGGATDVTVVATVPPQQLDRLEREDGVRVRRREWRTSDLDGAFLVIASAPDHDRGTRIADAARERGVLINVMDDVPNCDWAAPSLVRRADLVMAISTGGRSPALARQLRELLELRFGDEWGIVIDIVGDVRAETLPMLPDLAERARRWAAALDLDEAVALVEKGQHRELRERLRSRLLGERTATG